jgi:hypothetical protein
VEELRQQHLIVLDRVQLADYRPIPAVGDPMGETPQSTYFNQCRKLHAELTLIT